MTGTGRNCPFDRNIRSALGAARQISLWGFGEEDGNASAVGVALSGA
jgi:hypothetical protein